MRRQVVLRAVLLFLVVCAFAAIDAIVKGDHGGTRNAVGNVSAPWAFLPLLAGAFVRPRRWPFGMAIGATAAVVALACDAAVRAGAFGSHGGHRDLGDFAVAAGNRWLLLGAIGGAALGAAGSWLGIRRRWGVVAGVVAGLLVFEPVGRLAWASLQGDALRTFVPDPVVWGVEILCGLAVAITFLLRRSARPLLAD